MCIYLIFLCLCIYICIYVNIYINIYIYIHLYSFRIHGITDVELLSQAEAAGIVIDDYGMYLYIYTYVYLFI
jgi:DNA polymerase III epsilon subunit-like protein